MLFSTSADWRTICAQQRGVPGTAVAPLQQGSCGSYAAACACAASEQPLPATTRAHPLQHARQLQALRQRQARQPGAEAFVHRHHEQGCCRHEQGDQDVEPEPDPAGCRERVGSTRGRAVRKGHASRGVLLPCLRPARTTASIHTKTTTPSARHPHPSTCGDEAKPPGAVVRQVGQEGGAEAGAGAVGPDGGQALRGGRTRVAST